MHIKDDLLRAGMCTAPPAAVSLSDSLLTLQSWVAPATLVYIVLQVIYLVWKWRKEAKDDEPKDPT